MSMVWLASVAFASQDTKAIHGVVAGSETLKGQKTNNTRLYEHRNTMTRSEYEYGRAKDSLRPGDRPSSEK